MTHPFLCFQWRRLRELSPLDVHAMLLARESVFVVEQQCPYQETDRLDPESWHGLGRVNGELAAYARLVPPGLKFAGPSIGRVMTLPAYRATGAGRALMTEAIRFSAAEYPGQAIEIGAQVYLRAFYESFGFRQVGAEYDEDGIPHMDMIRNFLPAETDPDHFEAPD